MGLRTTARLGIVLLVMSLGAMIVQDCAAAAPPELTNAQIAMLSGPDRDKILIEGARKEGALVFYSQFVVEQVGRPLTEGFMKKYPFIKVKNVRSSGAANLQKLINEARAGKVVADVWQGSIAGTHGRRAGVIEQFKTPALEVFPKQYRNPDGWWVPVSLNFGSLVYNTEQVRKDEAPRTYDDLLNPKWKGKMAWTSDPGNGAPVLITALRLAWGEKKAMAFLQKLSKQDITDTGQSVTALRDTVVAGEHAIGIQTLIHSVAFRKRAKAPIDGNILVPVPGQIIPAALVKNAPHPYSAMLFIDYMLSKEGQTIIGAVNYALHPDVVATDELRPLVPRPDQEYILDPEKVADMLDSSSEIFQKLFRK